MAIIYDSDGFYDTIQPAYNPIGYIAQDDGLSGLGGVPPVVYCDVYFNFTYYKTIISTSPILVVGVSSYWYFDISGICQEFMSTTIPDITLQSFQQTFGGGYLSGAAKCYVKFRNSTQDAYGVITPGGIPPVQATVDSPAISGDGWQSDTFMVVNAALQITDVQAGITGFEAMLKQFRISGAWIGGFFPQNVDPLYRVYPLSYLKNGKAFKNDLGQLPFICCRNAFLGASSVFVNIYLFGFSAPGAIDYIDSVLAAAVLTDYSIFYLPVGLKQLSAMFPAFSAVINNTLYYQVAFADPAYSGVNKFMFVSPKYYIQQSDGLSAGTYPLVQVQGTPKHTRIWFQNYLGHFDQVDFIEREESLKVTSAPRETPLLQWNDGFSRSKTSISRNNVHGNENNIVTWQFSESDMPFLKQLMMSTKTYVEFISPENPDDVPPAALMLPIVIVDGEFTTLTWEGRFEYRLSIKYIMSNEYKIVRN